MLNTAIYPGTFDPVTLGHLDVIRRAARIFDRLVVAVAAHPRKQLWFNMEERMDLLRQSVRSIKGVEVVSFEGLLVDFARRMGVKVVIRGLRAFTDFEYEFQMALSNRKLASDIETLFLMTSETHSYFSSTAVREICELGGDTSGFVPLPVQRALRKRQEAALAARRAVR